MMKKVIAIVGPTAVGKTKLSIEIAKAFNGEIISTDSMQFYQGLDIGTAKIKKIETEGVKHHLIDILKPDAEFSVAEYQEIVREKIDELHKNDILPILVGGSGLYISSVLYDYNFKGEKRSDETKRIYSQMDTDELYEILQDQSPKLAKTVDKYNRRRVLRALEKSDKDIDDSGSRLFYTDALIIGLDLERENLYQRIDRRVDEMIDSGLIEEAKALFDLDIDSQATKAIGYKELFPYFRGEMNLEDCIELIKRNSRRYAKRQITWFKNKMEATWFEVNTLDFKETVNLVLSFLRESF